MEKNYNGTLRKKEKWNIECRVNGLVDTFKEKCKEANILYDEHNYTDNHLDYKTFGIMHRIFGKFLYEMGYYSIVYGNNYSYKKLPSNPKESLNMEQFALLYESNQIFLKADKQNYLKWKEFDDDITFVDFCRKNDLSYPQNTNKEKSLRDYIKEHLNLVAIGYSEGCICFNIKSFGKSKKLIFEKINEAYGFQLLTDTLPIRKGKLKVCEELLFKMDGFRWDLQKDSFNNGSMKTILLPEEYKTYDYYVQEIKTILAQVTIHFYC